MSQPSNLPALPASNAIAPTGSNQPANTGGGLELPIIGTVPFTDTAARWIRPLVPSFVADAIDTATHPLRTVRQAFEETEEITFTLRRTRKVTVDSTDSAHHARPHLPTIVTPDDPRTRLPQALSTTDHVDALTSAHTPTELEYRGRRQLPPSPDTP